MVKTSPARTNRPVRVQRPIIPRQKIAIDIYGSNTSKYLELFQKVICIHFPNGTPFSYNEIISKMDPPLREWFRNGPDPGSRLRNGFKCLKNHGYMDIVANGVWKGLEKEVPERVEGEGSMVEETSDPSDEEKNTPFIIESDIEVQEPKEIQIRFKIPKRKAQRKQNPETHVDEVAPRFEEQKESPFKCLFKEMQEEEEEAIEEDVEEILVPVEEEEIPEAIEEEIPEIRQEDSVEEVVEVVEVPVEQSLAEEPFGVETVLTRILPRRLRSQQSVDSMVEVAVETPIEIVEPIPMDPEMAEQLIKQQLREAQVTVLDPDQDFKKSPQFCSLCFGKLTYLIVRCVVPGCFKGFHLSCVPEGHERYYTCKSHWCAEKGCLNSREGLFQCSCCAIAYCTQHAPEKIASNGKWCLKCETRSK